MSHAMLERARKVTASQNWEVHPRFPFIMDRAAGVHMWDHDGNRYVDFTSCSGAAPLGAGFREVLDRTVEEMYRTGGIVAGPLSTLRVELAERLCALFPGAERVLFFRTGSCATTAAVRLARIHTGKRHVLTSGFHGWHDWHLQYRPHLALPDRDPDTTDFGYDLARLAELGAAREPAAVIVTPEVNFFPESYLRELAKTTRSFGALLIVDEVMTGFRYAPGGYAAAAGVRPDLITISKGLANGMALSAVLGSDAVMSAQEKTYVGNTFQRELTPFAAALATLDVYRREPPLERMDHIGKLLMDGLNDLFERNDIPAWAFARSTMFDLVFADIDNGHDFCTEMWRRGFLMQYGGRFMPSAATAEDDIEQALHAARLTIESTCERGQRPPTPPVAALIPFAGENFAATSDSVERWSSDADQ
ncbi:MULTISPECIES: aminotransferase class III-fold pyridoxal phosphate-dependent enzyme [unclassified Nocardia]|uniref:aminotransferase class III-fold pyridoxal phosphate-dependent enzyme n=1 Tax=unclassified Nocardia TaxID=2637762 RepID=UPI001CE3C498|nr:MULTISPECIES: aminotransferase class III-fold pyridoxal phosphate-dependent enzyme [unclassified Nocardia]